MKPSGTFPVIPLPENFIEAPIRRNSLKSLYCHFLVLSFFLIAATGSLAAPVPDVRIDRDGPAQPQVTMNLHELWRVGGEDEDVFFGRITDVKQHPNGETYILDNQTCQVVVISPDGEYLRTLSRQGDGPGELRQPVELVFLPDDVLGVGMGFPGKLVTMDLEGIPIGTQYPIGEPADGNIGVMISLKFAAGALVASGGRIAFSGPNDSHTLRFLAVSTPGADSHTSILEKTTPIDPTGNYFVEEDDYYIDRSWELGPDGRIYAPLKRDTYEVSVFDRNGELQFIFGRDLPQRKRTDEDKEEVGPVINTGTRGENWKICDRDEAVTRVMAHPSDGTIWVLTPHGTNDQPAGILETWDVFGPAGEFLRQVTVPLGNEIRDGLCNLTSNNRLIVVRGTGSSLVAREDEEYDDEEEIEPLEVICYEMR
jgi:hypothetical protein